MTMPGTEMDLTGVRRVGIIGAGVAGLSTAKTLLGEGIDCTLFERGDVLGGVWADGYSNFGAQVQKELYEFPDWPLPEGTPDFTPGPVIQKYLEDYAAHFAITPRIRLGATVRAVEKRPDGAGWRIVFETGGEERSEDFDLVVVSIGLYSNIPNMPVFPGQDSFGGEIMHISGLKSRDQLAGKRVCVVGYGKSATDAAFESAAVAAETSIVFRTATWPIPSRLAGIVPFKWGMLNRMCSTVIPPYYRPTAVERVVHTLGKPLVWFYWRLVEALIFFQCKLGSRFGARTSMTPSIPLEIGGFSESTMIPRPEFHRLVRNGAITPHRATIAEYTQTGVVLSGGARLDVDTVILGTGWKTDFGFFSEALRRDLGFEDDGFYLYRHMLHPDTPGLAFIGRASTIASILTYGLQARWLAELIGGRFSLPPRLEMLAGIEALKRWKRSWIPYSDARSARLIIHMQHYHDELLGDFGACVMRKRGVFGPLKEFIFPYEPGDYATIVSGAWREERLRRQPG